MKNTKPDMLIKTTLLERGWTNVLIKRFVPSSDDTRTNPIYKCASPMLLYRVDRIEKIEDTQEFKEALAKAEKRKASSKKAADKRRTKTIEWATSLPPPPLSPRTKEELTELAVQHYNDLWLYREKAWKGASINDDEDFLNRITVNYVRHDLTDYESNLRETYRKIGKFSAIELIREKIFDAISEAYPWLANECERQRW